jgi:gliding motility-associated-like protein
MKSIFTTLLCTLCLLGNTCFATHIFGGELLYQHQSGNTYKLTLTLYGDCSGTYIGNLDTAAPVIEIYNGAQYLDSLVLAQEPNSGIEVSPVCAKDLWNTTCKGGTLPGVKKFIYSGFITLPSFSNNWRFIFNGNTGNSSTAGRSNAITNIIFNPPAGNGTSYSIMCLEARLNNTVAPNSSPQYTTIPTPFYCNNVRQQYNQGAGDPDNDSLFFSLTSALENSQAVTYLPPFTAMAPIATSGFSFNSVNGQMNFTPNLIQDAVIVTVVQEYRNGLLIGSSMREMTFIILPNCSNRPPEAILDSNSIIGGVPAGNNTINVCESTPQFSFNINVNDSDNDTVTVIGTNLPQGAILNISKNNTPAPKLAFNWNTTGVPPGTYNFYVNLKDNGCPLSSNQTIAFTIKIIKKAEVIYSVINPTRCLFQQHVQLTINYGTVPRIVTILQNNAVIRTYTDSTGIVQDLFDTGNYHVIVTSALLLCNSEYDFTVVDSGVYPFSPSFPSPHYCIHDTPQPLWAIPGMYGVIRWYDINGNLLPGAPTFSTDTTGVFMFLVSELYKVCESKRDTVKVYVHEKPDAEILNKVESICTGDIIYLHAAGGKQYIWLPEDKIFIDKDSTVSARITEPTTLTLIAISQFGCKDTTSITYTDIQPCCMFSYPDVFTPNNDGKNDGFRVILYGNPVFYDLIIYNRWGQRVFHATNPDEYWNGMLGGKECDAGTYYYYLKAKCYTGKEEEHRGDIVLVR